MKKIKEWLLQFCLWFVSAQVLAIYAAQLRADALIKRAFAEQQGIAIPKVRGLFWIELGTFLPVLFMLPFALLVGFRKKQ